jgi:hypothetical protein
VDSVYSYRFVGIMGGMEVGVFGQLLSDSCQFQTEMQSQWHLQSHVLVLPGTYARTRLPLKMEAIPSLECYEGRKCKAQYDRIITLRDQYYHY